MTISGWALEFFVEHSLSDPLQQAWKEACDCERLKGWKD